MLKLLTKIGPVYSTALITLISIVSSIVITVTIFSIVGEQITPAQWATVVIAPLLIAPAVTWLLIRLLLRLALLEERMRVLATYDSLTGLLNRRAFLEAAEKYLELAKRYQWPFSLLLLDIDDFKAVNDKFGHSAGDDVLRAMGQVLSRVSRKSDLMGRYGGEEFILLLPETSYDNTLSFSERLHDAIAKECISVDDISIRMTVSVGVVLCAARVNDKLALDDLIKRADVRLYKAKSLGKSCTVWEA